MRAVDVMGFAGGFTLGVVQAGFELAGKRELPGGFGAPNCEANRHLLGYHWQTEAIESERWSVPRDVDFVFGNPPCSGFSVMSAKSFRGANSKVNACMWAFADYVGRSGAPIAAFESVQQAFTNEGGLQLMRDLRTKLEVDTGKQWTLTHLRHNAYVLGGAAVRRRYFWVVSQIPFGVEVPTVRRFPLLNDTISDITNLPLTSRAQPYRAPANWWNEKRRAVDPPVVDGHVPLRNPLTQRMQILMDAVDWRPGESIATVLRRAYDEQGCLPGPWQSQLDKLIKNDFFMGFTTPVRWDGNRPGRVITGGGPAMVVHPTLNRTLTFREVARIMGFPDDWVIRPLLGKSGHSMTWGKGITVDCGRWLGGYVKDALESYPGDYRGKLIGTREYDINFTHAQH